MTAKENPKQHPQTANSPNTPAESDWIKAIVSLPPGSRSEEVAYALMELGAAGVEIRDGETLLKTEENREELTAFFPTHALEPMGGVGSGDQALVEEKAKQVLNLDRVKSHLLGEILPILDLGPGETREQEGHGDAGNTGGVEIHFEDLSDQEGWADKWREYYSVMKITDRITICPVWEEYQPAQGECSGDTLEEVVIKLDPGQAFGTGKHATTTLCLEAIDHLYRTKGTFTRVLDVGSGSGILAIACALLGSRDITAVDFDPLCIDAIQENARYNSTGPLGEPIDYIDAYLLEAGANTPAIEPPGDLVLANIQTDVLTEIVPFLTDSTKEGGNLILSGILAPEAPLVTGLYIKAGFTLLGEYRGGDDGDWVTLSLQK